MKIGLFTVGTPKMAGGALLRTVAVNAERLGIETLWVPEHVVLLDQYASKYPTRKTASCPLLPTRRSSTPSSRWPRSPQ
jgi:alkanesulfonate monooxygenase SsuD/methylene tetrahydromethanopterin reductase-like flavin-dependent oxidoreductase (luciferase family)